MTELFPPTENPLKTTVNSIVNPSIYAGSDGSISLGVQGGYPPYSIVWQGNTSFVQMDSVATGLAAGIYTAYITDGANCETVSTITINEPNPSNVLFPNPFNGEVNVFFDMKKTAPIHISLYDLKGALVKELFHDQVKQGANLFSFSLHSLSQGTYVIQIVSEDEIIHSQKIVRH